MNTVVLGPYRQASYTLKPRAHFVVGLIATPTGYRLTDEDGIRVTDDDQLREVDNG